MSVHFYGFFQFYGFPICLVSRILDAGDPRISSSRYIRRVSPRPTIQVTRRAGETRQLPWRRARPGFHLGYTIAASNVICRSGFSREAISGSVTIAAEAECRPAAPTTNAVARMQSGSFANLCPGFHPGYEIAASNVICRSGFSRKAISGPVTIAAEAECRPAVPTTNAVARMQSGSFANLCPGFHPGYAIADGNGICRSGFSREAISDPVAIAAEAAPTTSHQPPALNPFVPAHAAPAWRRTRRGKFPGVRQPIGDCRR